MKPPHAERGSAGPPHTSGVSLVIPLITLAFGVRIAAAIARTTWGRCLMGGGCEGLLDAVLASPGSATLGLLVVGVTSIPLVVWLRSARSQT
jgi:hypothetical protein